MWVRCGVIWPKSEVTFRTGLRSKTYELTPWGRFILNLHENVEDGPDILEDLMAGKDPGGVVGHPDLYPGVLTKVAGALHEFPELRMWILEGYRKVVAALEAD
jgi:hypothetical protein